MVVLDGKALSEKLADKMAEEVKEKNEKGMRSPHLAAVLIGNHPASKAYVGNKMRLCEKIGFQSSLIQLPETISSHEILTLIEELNNQEDLDGYIVQLPLPKHIDEQKILQRINPDKDVDGFHPMNLGKMTLGLPTFKPATPYGILLLIEHYGIETAGQHCVVVGRSHIVGTPISILLSRKGYPGDATVTLTHSRTRNLKDMVRSADIVIAAIGIAEFVKGDWIKPGAVVIDVGINRVEDPMAKKGYKLVGDVEYLKAAEVASAITPVPGGVGPMTVMALIQNTYVSYCNKYPQ
jgi:methylenetetrahydrofolate dehydrogenase (NADP+) / methenyltetrahydrofolate cyclohydrolase